MTNGNTDTSSIITQGAAATIAPSVSTYFLEIVVQMLPFCYVAVPLIILDLYYGRRKAHYQYENGLTNQPVTIQKSIKMTLQKVFNYISWIFLSVSLGMAFNMSSLVIIIMAIIYGLEVMSLLNKYCEGKGIDIDEVGMVKLLFKFIWGRITGNNNEKFDDIVKKCVEKQEKGSDVVDEKTEENVGRKDTVG